MAPALEVADIQALISGMITVGDFEKFHELLRGSHPFLDTVLLHSPGGDLAEAMKIGRLIRRALIRTQAPNDITDARRGQGNLESEPEMPHRGRVCEGTECNCASACFLVWAAGIMRHGAALGLHRPTITSAGFGSLPPDRASVLYRQLLVDVGKYLNEMEVPQRFVETMTITPSTDIWWLNKL